MQRNVHKVFVYGTLKTGEPNHHWFSKNEHAYFQLVSRAETVEQYPLIIGTKYNIPFLLYSPGKGTNVQGELYEVDDRVFADLDELEDHPNFYIREVDKLRRLDTGETETAWIYFLKNFKPEMLDKPMLAAYSNEGKHGLKYVESEEATLEDLS